MVHYVAWFLFQTRLTYLCKSMAVDAREIGEQFGHLLSAKRTAKDVTQAFLQLVGSEVRSFCRRRLHPRAQS